MIFVYTLFTYWSHRKLALLFFCCIFNDKASRSALLIMGRRHSMASYLLVVCVFVLLDHDRTYGKNPKFNNHHRKVWMCLCEAQKMFVPVFFSLKSGQTTESPHSHDNNFIDLIIIILFWYMYVWCCFLRIAVCGFWTVRIDIGDGRLTNWLTEDQPNAVSIWLTNNQLAHTGRYDSRIIILD